MSRGRNHPVEVAVGCRAISAISATEIMALHACEYAPDYNPSFPQAALKAHGHPDIPRRSESSPRVKAWIEDNPRSFHSIAPHSTAVKSSSFDDP